MPALSGQSKTFTLESAQRLLPKVRRRTAEAVERAQRMSRQLEDLPESDPCRDQVLKELDHVVSDWARDVSAMGGEVKGLWLVDFDNGEGYYCWRYPEESVQHYHGHEEGFAGRMKVM